MNKIKKGDNGYIKSRLKIQTFKTLTGVLIIAALYIIGLVRTDGNRNNYYTLAAILAVLPTAKIAVNMYMFFIRRKLSPSEKYEKLKNISTRGLISSDMIMTVKDKVYGIDFAVVTDTGICCYTEDEKLEIPAFCESAENFIRSCGYDVNVTVLKDFKKFCERTAGLKNIEMDDERAEEVKHAFLIMSL